MAAPPRGPRGPALAPGQLPLPLLPAAARLATTTAAAGAWGAVTPDDLPEHARAFCASPHAWLLDCPARSERLRALLGPDLEDTTPLPVATKKLVAEELNKYARRAQLAKTHSTTCDEAVANGLIALMHSEARASAPAPAGARCKRFARDPHGAHLRPGPPASEAGRTTSSFVYGAGPTELFVGAWDDAVHKHVYVVKIYALLQADGEADAALCQLLTLNFGTMTGPAALGPSTYPHPEAGSYFHAGFEPTEVHAWLANEEVVVARLRQAVAHHFKPQLFQVYGYRVAEIPGTPPRYAVLALEDGPSACYA